MKLGEKTRAGLLLFLFALPFLSGMIPRWIKNWPLFWSDYEAVACAGQHALAGTNYYLEGFEKACAGMDASRYIYLPWVAETSGWLTATLGAEPYRWLYIAIYSLAVFVQVWTMLFDKKVPGSVASRAPFLGLVTGSAIAWGNISVLAHGLAAATARLAMRYPIVFALACALAGAIKPIFLLYLLILLYAPWPLWKRGFWFAVGVAAGLAPFGWFILNGGDTVDAWRGRMELSVFTETPGDGYFGWVELFGLDARNRFVYAGYGLFLVLVAGAGLAIAEGAKLSANDRLWLGMGVAVLLIPRIMSQDFFLIAPAMMVALVAAKALSDDAHKLARRVIFGGCIVALVGNLADAGDYANKIAWLAFVGTTLSLGYVYGRRWLAEGMAFSRTSDAVAS